MRPFFTLQENHLKKKKYLRYCTKYADPNTINQDYVDFSQYRWYELAHFLSRYEENLLIKTYLDFLYNNNMSQDNTIKSEQLLTIEHLRKTIEIIEFHIDNSKSNFSKFFGAASNINKNTNWNQIKSQNRICFYQENVLVSNTNQYSEVLYAIEFDELKMVTQIYVDKKHEQYPNIVNEIVEGVKSNTPLIRHEMAKRTRHQLRRMPELLFFGDDSLDYIEDLDKSLKGEDVNPIKNPDVLPRRQKR